MSGISSTYLLQRSDDGILPLTLCVRDSDPHGRRLARRGSVALGGSAALVQYSPTRRDDFLKCDSAGARPISLDYQGDTTITYAYGTESFRPVSMNVANSGAFAYYSYDASGNVWLDRNTDNVYKLNALGLPEKVSLYSSITNNVTQDVVDNDIQLSEEIGNTRMAYDESGNRIWTYPLIQVKMSA